MTKLSGAPVDLVSRVIDRHAGSSDPAELAQELAQALLQALDAELVEIWSREGGRLARQAAQSRDGVPPPAGAAEQFDVLSVASTGRIPAVSNDFVQWSARAGVAQVMALPMHVGSRDAGVIAVYLRSSELTPEQLNRAHLYAAMAGLALGDARVLAENHKAIMQLQFLVEASQVLNSTLDLAELLDLILNLACKEISAERGSVYLVDQEHRQIWTILAHGVEQEEIRLSFGQGVAGHVAETGRVLNVADAYTCEYFDRSFDEKFNYRTRNLLCTPIRNRTGATVGILQLLNKSAGNFNAQDEEFLNALSVHMALALENAQLHRDLLEKQRLERELQLARNIQRSLLPDAPPSVPGYDIAVLNEPCFEVGGDYYDFLTLGPNTMLLVIADVEGKGVSSAMVMSNLQATLRALVMHLHSLEVITLSLNEMILTDTRSEKFLSIFLGLVDTRRRGLHYINAGHIPPLLIRADDSVLNLEDGGMVIGLFNAVEYNRGSLKLLPGDILICCTDGIIEACGEDQEEYGIARLTNLVKANKHLSAQELVDHISSDVRNYVRGVGHIDDKVLMVMKVLEDLDPKVNN